MHALTGNGASPAAVTVAVAATVNTLTLPAAVTVFTPATALAPALPPSLATVAAAVAALSSTGSDAANHCTILALR